MAIMTSMSRSAASHLAALEDYRQAINASLERYFAEPPDLPFSLTPVAEQAFGMVAEFTLRPGKRVRGALAALAYDRLTGQELSSNGQALAVALELMQSYILILDDVTDQSELRRGEPTVHRLYEHAYDGRITGRMAEQLADYAAIITQHLANIVLLNVPEQPERIHATLARMHQNIALTGFGQMDDVLQQLDEPVTRDDIIRKYTLKTSYYTFINPLQMGMALAGIADEAEYRQVAEFGVAAGVAFQMHDDYLGIFGGADATGKSNTDDIREGKLTRLVQYALEHGSVKDTQELRSYLGNQHIGDREVQAVRAIFDRTGATMEVRAETQHYADEAMRHLSAITFWNEAFKALLGGLVQYSVNRQL